MLWIIASVATLVLAVASIGAALFAPTPDRRMKHAAFRERREHPRGWWRLEFIDPDKPEAHRSRGVAYVEAHGIASAALRARELNINPGGVVSAREVRAAELPSDDDRQRLLHVSPPDADH